MARPVVHESDEQVQSGARQSGSQRVKSRRSIQLGWSRNEYNRDAPALNKTSGPNDSMMQLHLNRTAPSQDTSTTSDGNPASVCSDELIQRRLTKVNLTVQ